MYAKIFLGLAIALTASCLGFTFHGEEVRWFWEASPKVPYYLGSLALLGFGLYYRER